MRLSNKRALVTGAAGFIGHHLVKRLTRIGAEVVALDNFSIGKKENLKLFEGEIMEADVCERNLIRRIKGDIDFILHFGAPSSVILFNRDLVKRFDETVSGFLNIMELAKEKNVEKVVYPSSGSLYGKSTRPQSENMKPQPANLYGVAKLTCEEIARLYQYAVKSVGLRIFAGYGPGEDHKGEIASPVTIFLKAIMKDESPIVYGDGTQSRDFVYIDDVIEAIIKATEKETHQIMNVGSGRTYTFNYVIKVINELLGKNVKPRYIHKPLNYLERTQADISLMKNALAIEPLTLEKGLKRYLDCIQ